MGIDTKYWTMKQVVTKKKEEKKGTICVNEIRQRPQSRKGVNELPQVSSGQTKPSLRAEHTVRVHTIHVEATTKRLEFFRLKQSRLARLCRL